jgi:hypothetical protein
VSHSDENDPFLEIGKVFWIEWIVRPVKLDNDGVFLFMIGECPLCGSMIGIPKRLERRRRHVDPAASSSLALGFISIDDVRITNLIGTGSRAERGRANDLPELY